MPTIDQVVTDPDFYVLPAGERKKVLSSIDQDFAGMSENEQLKAVAGLSEKFSPKLQSSHSPQTQKAEPVPTWKNSVQEAAALVLPVAGAVVGGIAGLPFAPETLGVSVPASGALGYGIGKQGADTIGQFLGTRERGTVTEEALRPIESVYEGAQFEALGAGIGKAATVAAPIAARGAKWTASKIGEMVRPAATAESTVAQAIANTGRGSAAVEAETEALKNSIPGLNFTTGVTTGNADLVGLERAAINSGKPGFEGIKQKTAEMQQGNIEAVSDSLKSFTGGDTSELVKELARQKAAAEAQRAGLQSVDRLATGEALSSTVSAEKEPVRAAMKQLGDGIPNYPMTTTNTEEALKTAISPNLSDMQKGAIQKIADSFSKNTANYGKTTQSLHGIRRTVDELIDTMMKNSPKSAPPLLDIKKAIDADFAALGNRARTGEIAEVNGKMVDVDSLAAELERNLIKAAEISGKTSPDVNAMVQRLGPQNLRVPGQTEASHLEATIRDFQREFPGEAIPASGTSAKEIAELTKRNETIRNTLNQIDPAIDAGAALNAYNKYAQENWFGRFGNKSLSKADASLTENATNIFTTQTGARDLIKAVGPDNAKTIMTDHYKAELSAILDKNPTDAAIASWMAKNRRVLAEYGIADDLFRIAKSQRGYKLLEKITGADMQSVFATVISGDGKAQVKALEPILKRIKGNASATAGLKQSFAEYLDAQIVKPMAAGNQGFGQAEKLFKKLDPAIKKIYSPAEIAKLNDVRTAISRTQKLTEGSPLGGSQTNELGQAAKTRIIEGKPTNRILDAVLSTMAGIGGHAVAGPLGVAAAPAISIFREAARKSGDEAVRKYFYRAMFDPAYAQSLKNITSGTALGRNIQQTVNRQIMEMAAQVGTVTAMNTASNQ